MPGQTRERIVDAAGELFRRQGYTGTGLKRILTEAGAPFGSLYHFFPGGKDELAAATIRAQGAHYLQVVAGALLSEEDPVDAVGAVFARAAEDLVASDYADACPIATVALEVASTNEALREAAAEAFEGWLRAGTVYFRQAGADAHTARALTTQLVMLLEGAFLLARTTRSTEPLDVAARAIRQLTTVALDPER